MPDFKDGFVGNINNSFSADPDESVLDALFREYEHVIFRSIITSFGLDIFIKDQYGGDVDTLHNVRAMGSDPQLKYKSGENEAAYDSRGVYSHKDVEGPGTNFQTIKHDARAHYVEDPRNNTVQDAYEDRPLHFLGGSKGRPTDKSAELDHVISAKSIHDDRGRLLAGLSTAELADAEDNLKWTNEHLNKSMGADEIPDYIEKHPELPADVKARMMDAYAQSKATYEKTIITAYYFDFSNPHCRQFYKQAAESAANRGIQMGIRQAAGFLITELWFSVKDAIRNSDGTFGGICTAIVDGLKVGVIEAGKNYKALFGMFGEGVLSGILSSITSTVTNMFVTTGANAGRIIRQGWASTVEATAILFFNDKDQYLCDRMTSAAKVLATGASVITGTVVQEQVSIKLSEINLPSDLKDVISVFSGTLCTGLMSVSLMFYIDNGPFTKFLTDVNGENTRRLQEQGMLFKRYCAELEKIDIGRLSWEADYIYGLYLRLDSADNQQDINTLLRTAVTDLGLPSVFGGYTIDERMQDKTWVLKF